MTILRALLLAALFLARTSLATSLTLEGSTDALEVVTAGSAVSLDYDVSWSNVTATALTTPGVTHGNINSATTTTLVAAPSASNWRHVRGVRLYNAHASVVCTVTVQIDVSATNRLQWKGTVAPGESVQMGEEGEWRKYDATGRRVTAVPDVSGYTGYGLPWTKTTTGADTIGYHYLMNKDAGNPPAQSWGTPGVNGNNTDCSSATTAATGAGALGSPYLPDPASGSLFMTNFVFTGGIVGHYRVIDILWYNTGLTVTTTTEQTFTTPTWDARDATGATTGYGLGVALYALTTVANAAAVSNTTLRYTNTVPTGSRTATFSAVVGSQAPQTALIGTFMPFQLAAGDAGITSIQGITLATSFVSGTLGVIVYRDLGSMVVGTANVGGTGIFQNYSMTPGIRLYNNTCLGVVQVGSSATTATTFGGTFTVMER